MIPSNPDDSLAWLGRHIARFYSEEIDYRRGGREWARLKCREPGVPRRFQDDFINETEVLKAALNWLDARNANEKLGAMLEGVWGEAPWVVDRVTGGLAQMLEDDRRAVREYAIQHLAELRELERE